MDINNQANSTRVIVTVRKNNLLQSHEREHSNLVIPQCRVRLLGKIAVAAIQTSWCVDPTWQSLKPQVPQSVDGACLCGECGSPIALLSSMARYGHPVSGSSRLALSNRPTQRREILHRLA